MNVQQRKIKFWPIALVIIIVFVVVGLISPNIQGDKSSDDQEQSAEQQQSISTPKYEIVKDNPTKNAIGKGTWETYYVYVSDAIERGTDDGNAKIDAIIKDIKTKTDEAGSPDGYRFKAYIYSDKELAQWESDPMWQSQNYDAMTAKLPDHQLAFYDGITNSDEAKIQYFNGADYTEKTFNTKE